MNRSRVINESSSDVSITILHSCHCSHNILHPRLHIQFSKPLKLVALAPEFNQRYCRNRIQAITSGSKYFREVIGCIPNNPLNIPEELFFSDKKIAPKNPAAKSLACTTHHSTFAVYETTDKTELHLKIMDMTKMDPVLRPPRWECPQPQCQMKQLCHARFP